MKKFVSLLLVCCMLLTLTACGGGDNETTTQGSGEESTVQGGEAVAGQYYNTYIPADPTSMDISRNADSYSGTLINNVMESLIRVGEENGEYKIKPGDAQSWEVSDDGLVWTFHLGDNCWSDGQPVTAEQYVYSLKRSVDPATGCPNEWFLYPIAGYDEIRNDGASLDTFGVKALDDKTLEITLSFPMPSILEMMSGTIYYPQRQDIVEQYGDKYGSEAEYTVFNGPYVLSEWTHNSKLVLTKNPYYWDADNVQLETVNLNIMDSENTIYSSYESGALDYVSTSDPDYIDEFMSRNDSTYIQAPTATLAYSFYNAQDELFKNANVRKAFTLALDREELNEMCFNGANIPTYGWICPAISVGETNFREYAGDPIQEMIDEMKADGKTAKDYLLQGMQELGLGDNPSTLKISFSLAGTDEWFRTFGDYLQQVYQEELGVQMEIKFNDWSIFYNDVQNGNYQIAYMSWGAYYNDPYDMLNLFESNNDAIETGWSNADYDALVEKAARELDDSKRIEMYKQAEDLLLRQECVVSPILTFSDSYFYRDYVTGYGTLTFSMGGYKGLSTGARP